MLGDFQPGVTHTFFAASCEKRSKARVIIFKNDESVTTDHEVGKFGSALEPFRRVLAGFDADQYRQPDADPAGLWVVAGGEVAALVKPS